MKNIGKILLVEDNRPDAVLLQEMLAHLASQPLDVCWVQSLKEAIEAMDREHFAAILLDLSLPDSYGLDSIRQMSAAAPVTPILVITGSIDEDIAAQAVRCGAEDYLVKG